MRALMILLTMLVVFCLLNWIRADAPGQWPLPQALPFVGGHEPGIYDVAGVIMLAMLLSCIFNRSGTTQEDQDDDSPEHEDVNAPEDEPGGDDDEADEQDEGE